MKRVLLFLFAFICAPSVYGTQKHFKGSVELDEFTFDKIIGKFDAALVKFDVPFPYGAMEDTYSAFAQDVKDVSELVVASIGVKDYGANENEALAKRYGVSKEDFPVVKLFVKGTPEPVTFNGKFTRNDLRLFVKENSGVYVSRPGCDKRLDDLVKKFVGSSDENKRKIIKEAEKIIKTLSDQKLLSGKIYKSIMEKVVEKGDEFVDKEVERLNKILKGAIKPEKKKELETRLDILESFTEFKTKAKASTANEEL